MREIDEVTIRDFVPGIELMENAGAGVTEELLNYFKPTKTTRITVVCGKGNNGGDGFVIARLLKKKGRKVSVYLLGKTREMKGDAATNLKRCTRAKIKVNEIDEKSLGKLEDELLKAGIIVDAIFGTGFEGKPRGISRDIIQFMNDCPAVKVAVDIPSGVNASTGEAELAVDADLTVTMALPKRGLFLFPGKGYTGDLVVHDIGVPPEVVIRENLNTFVLGKSDIEEALPVKLPDAHKWSCGHALAICGSTGFTGAASLTSISAMRSGCGLVTLVTPRSLNPVMEIKLTEVMTLPVDETPAGSLAFKAGKAILDFAAGADAVAIGPGLSQNRDTVKLVKHLLPRLGVPTVLDADGLNAFAGKAEKLKGLDFPLIITPHVGEASRLFGIDKKKILSRPVEFARKTAKDLGLVMVLKGAPTIIAGPDGDTYINPTGNQGLATAGSGDVLTGIIAGLLAQGADVLEAAASGVYIHGLIADLLLEEYGYFGFMAGELAETIPEAIADIVWE
jgi:NAD(P)H-hydrate epimerase